MIPCKDCLLLPACKHKRYIQLINDCLPLFQLLYMMDEQPCKTKRFREIVLEIDNLMKTEHRDNRYTRVTVPLGGD